MRQAQRSGADQAAPRQTGDAVILQFPTAVAAKRSQLPPRSRRSVAWILGLALAAWVALSALVAGLVALGVVFVRDVWPGIPAVGRDAVNVVLLAGVLIGAGSMVRLARRARWDRQKGPGRPGFHRF